MTRRTARKDPLANVSVVGEGFDDHRRRHLKLKVKGSNRNLRPYSMADIVKPDQIYCDLGNAGCNVFSSPTKRDLLELLENYEQQEPSFSVVTRLGAYRNFYVRPNEIIGEPPLPVEPVLGSLNADMLSKYWCQGSLEDWQGKIGQLCAGNSRLMFAVSLACTGPILPFVAGPRTGGFQIWGPAEKGKTAAAMVAGSIWGCHGDSARNDKGFAESWNSTVNELERTAQAHSDALLILDETNLAGGTEADRAKAVLDGLFKLSENTQKGRFNESRKASWRVYFLSTSNLTLDELANLGGVVLDDQHRSRLVDISLPSGAGTFGIYESLHGFADGAALTDAIKARCRSVFGTPGYVLVRNIYRSKKSRSAAKRFVTARRKFYINRIKQEATSRGLKPLGRATGRFATVYAAGCLAIKYGIFTWSRRDLLWAILSCQLDGLVAARGKTDPVADLRQKLLDHLAQNRHHFMDLNDAKPLAKTHTFGSAPGYIQTHRGERWIYLTADQLKKVIGTGKAAGRLKKRLVREGLMAVTGERALVQRPVFRATGNKGYKWVHAFRAALLDS